jgi:hypothetical protein
MVSTYSLYSSWLILLSVCQFANCQTCYWPNGMESDFKQCSTTGGACCYNPDDAHHDPCFSNGLCQSIFFGYIYRGACTDSSWGASCPNVCTSGITPSNTSRLTTPLSSNSHQHPTNIKKTSRRRPSAPALLQPLARLLLPEHHLNSRLLRFGRGVRME